MSLFKNLTSQGLEESQDRLGGGGAIDSGIYTGKIKVAYAGQSSGGAQNVTLVLDLGGREYRETVYITNKKGENFFLNKDDKTKKVPLPGFTVIDDICLVTQGSPLADQDVEEKIVKVYDFDAKAEVNKAVPVLVGLIGQTVSLGIRKTLENKSVKDASSGEYVPTADTREVNNIDKVFHTETRLTTVEARNGIEEAGFWDAWEKKNKGVTQDKRTIKDGEGGAAGAPRAAAKPGVAPQAGDAPAKPKSLFGKK